jgi:hypothetical protein
VNPYFADLWATSPVLSSPRNSGPGGHPTADTATIGMVKARSAGKPGGGRSLLFFGALLTILGAVFAISCSGRFSSEEPIPTACFLAGGVAWLLAMGLARRGVGDLRVVVAGAVALRLLAWAGDAGLSDDVYRYLWEGEVVIEGTSPYAHPPDDAGDPALARLRHRFPDLHARVNHKEVRAAYPPLSQAASAAVAALCRMLDLAPETAGVRILRALFALCDLLVLWPLAILLDRARSPRALAVVWGWCPLPAIEFAGSGHLDSLGILLLVGALAAGSSDHEPSEKVPAARRGLPAVILLSAGILVKYVPAAALPWITRGRGAFGRAALVLLLCALGFAPFLFLRGSEHGFFSGLEQYALRWDSGNLVHRWIEGTFAALFARDETWTDPRRLARAVSALVWLVLAVGVVRRERDTVRGTCALIGAWLVLSPTLHPWYLCWMLPFLTLRFSAAWSWLVLAAPLLYWPLAGWQREGVWTEPAWLWPVLALPFFALLVREWAARRGVLARPSSPVV